MRGYECYHAVCQYSADACSGCEHEMDCYHHFLKHILWRNNMTVFESIKNKNIDELAEWLEEHGDFDNAPWWQWWDENYCNKCESEVAYVPEFNKKCEFAWCEINGKCKFFKEMDEMPNNKQIVKMWLESEVR